MSNAAPDPAIESHSDPFPLRGRRAFVGGASKGIGRACAEALAAAGASVTATARSEGLLHDLARALPTAAGQTHDYVVLDYARPQALDAALTAWLAAAGPYHVLVNNTGGPPAGPITDAEEEDFRRAFELHLVTAHLLTQHLLPGMKAEGYGRVINVISTSVKQPLAGLGVSNTIRAAVANWAKTLAGEVAVHGITVNNVLPGATRTERLAEIIAGKAKKTGKTEAEVTAAMQAAIPAQRFAEPGEVAAAVAFLASPKAAYITGINLPVDGGRTSCL
jgi:3-oxoacyl-[acyl-carrier protein] reductase